MTESVNDDDYHRRRQGKEHEEEEAGPGSWWPARLISCAEAPTAALDR